MAGGTPRATATQALKSPQFAVLGVMPLYAVLARAYFASRIMGTVVGAMTLASSFGMALGPAVGGWIFDTFRSYAWLYIGSLAVGLGAAAIALAFPPVRAIGSRAVPRAA